MSTTAQVRAYSWGVCSIIKNRAVFWEILLFPGKWGSYAGKKTTADIRACSWGICRVIGIFKALFLKLIYGAFC